MLLLCELIRCLMFKFEQTTPPPGRVFDPIPSAVPMVPSAPGGSGENSPFLQTLSKDGPYFSPRTRTECNTPASLLATTGFAALTCPQAERTPLLSGTPLHELQSNNQVSSGGGEKAEFKLPRNVIILLFLYLLFIF